MTSISSILGTASDLASRGVRYAPEIARAACEYGLDPRLLAAVAAQETGGPGSNAGRNVVGDGGHGRGLFQIDDRFHAFARRPEAMNPQANAEYAAGMLSGLLHRYGNNVHRALSAYNAGDPNAPGSLTRWQDGASLGYADSVLRHYSELGGPAPGGTAPNGPQFESLLEMLQAESGAEQAGVNALSTYSYRRLDAHHTDPSSIFTDNGDS